MKILSGRVLFLDFDGVLNTKGGEPLRHDKVDFVNAIFHETDCDIVIISAWRKGRSCSDLTEILRDAGYEGRPVIGKTPILCDEGAVRDMEIMSWLANNQSGLKSYAILDDAANLQRLMYRSVRIDSRTGLEVNLAQIAIQMLKKDM